MNQQTRIIIVLIFSGIIILFLVSRSPRQKSTAKPGLESQSATLPKLDYSQTEKQVADKLRRLLSELQRNSGSADKWGLLALNLHIHGFKQQALTCYKHAADLDPNEFRWAYLRAILLEESGSNDATLWFERAYTIRTDYEPLLVRQAESLLNKARVQEAAAKFQQAIELNSRCSHAYLGLAQIAFTKNDLQESRNYVEKSLNVNPKFGEAHSLLATIYRLEKQPQKADAETAVALSLPDKTPLVDPVYASLVAEGVSSYWYRVRGRAHLENGFYEEAAQDFEGALKAKPDSEAYNNMGAVMEKLGRLEDALTLYKKSIALHPTGLAYSNLGSVLGKLNRYSESIEASLQAAKLTPKNPDVYFNIGVAHFKMERWDRAVDPLRQAVRLKFDHALAHYLLTECYLALNDKKSARAEFEILKTLDRDLASKLEAQFQ